jgi:hypothetical protein
MLNKIFSRPNRLEHPDPAERAAGVAELPPDSDEVLRVLSSDPAPVVRTAAARQANNVTALAEALTRETDPGVRDALGDALAGVADPDELTQVVASGRLSDRDRAVLARRAPSAAVRSDALAAIHDEATLLELAQGAEHAETRIAAAERIASPEALQRLADAARNKDNGVARLARQRLDAIRTREAQGVEADAILVELEALATRPGPILTAVVELNRRWQALDLAGDQQRLARCDAARQVIQERFDREQEEQRTRAAFERRVREWVAALDASPPDSADALDAARSTESELRAEAERLADRTVVPALDAMRERIAQWDAEHAAHAGAEALVLEAERLAADTSIDNADLPARWQSLDRATRTPELTRRFEAALMTVEQRRLAQIQATQQETNAIRLKLHGLLHAAEQALAAGELKAARTAADEVRGLKAGAGTLPKPTIQRLSRVMQQLADLEKWESFGQQSARMQLVERAEALPQATSDFTALAHEVQKLRNEWKALDQQYAGVPKALWERFDRACERAYAPAARHFAELGQQRTDARKRREDFIAAAAAHAPTLVTDPPDWRAIEKWLRETDHAWREGDLGSVDPGSWKKLDARLKDAVAPARDALIAARDKAKAARQALIDEVKALGAKAMERDTPGQVKAIQQRWQEQARGMSLLQRDERALWEQFRSACDAVFEARNAKRKEEDGRKSEHRRALDDVCERLDTIARDTAKSDQELKRALRDAQDQWKALTAKFDPAVREVEGRYRRARAAVEATLTSRARSRESASWQTLAAKEAICDRLDQAVAANVDDNAAQSALNDASERWAALPELEGPQEKAMASRRDGAVAGLTDPARRPALAKAIEDNATRRREILLELELLLGLDTPPAFKDQRLALQVKLLKDRFKSAATVTPENAGERILAWCAASGVADSTDRQRIERIFARAGRRGEDRGDRHDRGERGRG